MTETISGAELKVVLGGLGLSPAWFAERLNVNMRTVVRWFDNDIEDIAIPPRAADELAELQEMTLNEMRRLLKAGNKGVLQTYRTDREFESDQPASWHRALTFRVLEHLRAQGDDVVVVYDMPAIA